MYGHVSEKMQKESAARMDAYILGLDMSVWKLVAVKIAVKHKRGTKKALNLND